MDVFAVRNLFRELSTGELLRVELINGSKLYINKTDEVYVINDNQLHVCKTITEDTYQNIVIDCDYIVITCSMSEETYNIKKERGELYV